MTEHHAELRVENACVFNTYFKTFAPADVWIKDGRFYYIEEKTGKKKTHDAGLIASETVDAGGRWLVPGLIDIHMHIESSMMTPAAFGAQLARCGVTTVVTEPHEMANVNGMAGVEDMIKAGAGSPVDMYYGIPSCVPASNPDLETTGGQITAEDMERLRHNPAVVCVGEVMNYRQIIHPNHLEITKFLHQLRRDDRIFPIEGHCPALLDLDLARFLYLGINADHTEHSLEELRQRFAGGMFMEIQEKMLTSEVLEFIRTNRLEEHFCFVTDDVMADTLCREGHLDALVRKAIALGMEPQQALYNASYTPARRMNLLDRGAVAPGHLADFVLLDDLNTFRVAATYKRGQCIYTTMMEPSKTSRPHAMGAFSKHYYNSIRLTPCRPEMLEIPAPEGAQEVRVRVMVIRDGSTRTTQREVTMPVRDGLVWWQDSGCLLAAVFERYGKNGGVGYGFITGDCHQRGAVATSYAHDNHNILVAGATPEDMLLALNRVIALQGGMIVAEKGRFAAELQLNVGGILSDRPAAEVGAGLEQVRAAMKALGYRHYNPIMSFGTLTLTVSPAIKLTDKGLIDVTSGQVVSMFV